MIEINNKKVKFDYFIIDKIEAGIVLKGAEIKSIREGKISLKESFCKIINGEIFVFGMHISHYSKANTFYSIEEDRVRKLLLKKKEIKKLESNIKLNGYSIVPVKLYFNENNKCKIEIALVKGKKNYDKRNSLKEKTQKRDIERSLKG